MKCKPWAVEVWLDSPKGVPPQPPAIPLPPPEPMKLGSLGRDGPIMAFNGTANGAEALFLADTGGSKSINV
jgi:hypothetical protein